MRFARLGLLGLILMLTTACAEFPSGEGSQGFTRLSFLINFNGAIDPTYFYVVAIRVLTPPVGTDVTLGEPNYGPSPVVGPGSKNGIVGGLPTHYVIFAPTDPNLYQVYRFPTRASEGANADPTDPAAMDLRWPGVLVNSNGGDVLPGSGVNPVNTDGTYGSQLGFSIDTSYLLEPGQPISAAQKIQIIQVNILTMTTPYPPSGNTSSWVMDAIGDQRGTTVNDPIPINLISGGQYSSTMPPPFGVPETALDTLPNGSNLPAVDMISWQVNVIAP